MPVVQTPVSADGDRGPKVDPKVYRNSFLDCESVVAPIDFDLNTGSKCQKTFSSLLLLLRYKGKSENLGKFEAKPSHER